MPLAVHQCFQLTCGTYFIELMQNYPGQITALKDGIEVLMRGFRLTTQRSGNSWTILREKSRQLECKFCIVSEVMHHRHSVDDMLIAAHEYYASPTVTNFFFLFQV